MRAEGGLEVPERFRRLVSSQLGKTRAAEPPHLLLGVADLLRPCQQEMDRFCRLLGFAEVMVHPEPHDLRVRPVHVVADPLADRLAFVCARANVVPVSDAHGIEAVEHVGVAQRRRIVDFQVAQEIDDPSALGYAHMLNSLYSVSVGHWHDVRSSADECQSICERIGDHVNWANAQVVRFWMHHYLGETEQSAEAVHLLLARAQKIGNAQQEVWGLCGAGLAELRRNQPAEALRYLEAALGTHEDNDQNNLILTLGCAALARMRLGEIERAHEDAQRALAMLIRARRPTGHATLEGRSAIAEVILRAPDVRLDLARLSVDGLRRYRNVFPIGNARYHLWRGVLLSATNRRRGAARSWKSGIQAARSLSMRHDELLIEEEIATARSLAP